MNEPVVEPKRVELTEAKPMPEEMSPEALEKTATEAVMNWQYEAAADAYERLIRKGTKTSSICLSLGMIY